MDNLQPSGEPIGDVVLICDNRKYECHREVLSKHSAYFNAMFSCDMKESRSHEIRIEANPTALKELINFAYTNKFLAKEENVFSMLEASTMFQFDVVQAACIDFLKVKLDSTNCLDIMCFADSLGLMQLYHKAYHLALWSFDHIKDCAEILDLRSESLASLLSHDGLRVKFEVDVFYCVIRWIEHELEPRISELLNLLQLIRFASIALNELSTISETTLIKKDAKAQELLKNIYSYKSIKNSFLEHKENQLTESNLEVTNLNDLAQSLINSPKRMIPAVPVIIAQMIGEHGEKTSTSHVAYYDVKTKNLHSLVSLDKIWANSSVAMGYRVSAVGQNIYITGGEVMLGYSNWNLALWSYDIFRENWTFCCNLPQPRRHHSTCVLGNDIYIIGGIGRYRVILSNVDRYDTSTGEWKSLQPLPVSAYSAACTAHQNFIFVLTSEVYRYNPVDNVWLTYEMHLPNQNGFHTALSHERGIYLLGRHNKDLILYHTDYKSSNDASAYTVIGQFTYPSEHACLINDLIYSFNSNSCCSVEVYDIVNDVFYVDTKNISWTAKLNYGSFLIPHYS